MRTKRAVIHLPTPAENPSGDVVLYDGQCMFCQIQTERMARWDFGRRLAFLSLHDPQVATLYPDLRYDRLLTEMHVVDRHGNRYAGAAALRYLSLRLPVLYPLALLLHLPGTMPFWQWLYRQIALRRYSFFGRTEAGCASGACEAHLD